MVKEPKLRKKTGRKGFVPRLRGYLVQMDTISIFGAGLKRNMFTATEVITRFAFVYTDKSNSSANGNDFLGKFIFLLSSKGSGQAMAVNSPNILMTTVGITA